MIDTCRLYYQENPKKLSLIGQFEHEYQSNNPIHCFLKYSFLQKMINKALQTKNIDQIYMLRYFLGDLIENLSYEYKRKVLSPLHSDTQSTHLTDLIDVLFEIECNGKELDGTLIFTHMTQSSENPSQKQVLFDLNTTFRLKNIQLYKQVWSIKIIAVNNGRFIIQKYIDDTRRQIENLSIRIIFGKFLCDMC